MPLFILNDIIIVKKTHGSCGNPVDVEVQSIEEEAPTRTDKRRDVDQFFHPAVERTTGNKTKKYCRCKLCLYVSRTSIIWLLNHQYQRQKEPRQREYNFTPPSGGTPFSGGLLMFHCLNLSISQGQYHKWAQEAKFESKLPGDITKHKAATECVTRTINRDLREEICRTSCSLHRQAFLPGHNWKASCYWSGMPLFFHL